MPGGLEPGSLPAQALPPAGRAIPARVASWASPSVWYWWRACRQPVGPHGLMCAPRSGTRGRGKRLGRRLDGRRGARRPRPPKKNLCRAAPRAGPGRFHCRVRELWSRRPFGRMFNGPGGSDPSPMFVAATVRLLLPPATDTKSLRRPRHIQIPAVPFPRGEDHGRWMAFGRPQRRPRTRRIRVPLIGCDSW